MKRDRILVSDFFWRGTSSSWAEREESVSRERSHSK